LHASMHAQHASLRFMPQRGQQLCWQHARCVAAAANSCNRPAAWRLHCGQAAALPFAW
jgi:hypothetical protein